MSNTWVKIGCFLTGYKYSRLKHCSIASEKTVKKYMSAIVLICMLWFFIGYAFTYLYIINSDTKTEVIKGWFDSASLAIAIVMVIAVIQIERQIILSDRTNKWARGFRIVIGFVMAIIGSIIIDQILFHKDIETADLIFIEQQADSLLPSNIKIINDQITIIDNDNSIIQKEIDSLSANYNRNPVFQSKTSISTSIPHVIKSQDLNGNVRDTIVYTNKVEYIPNTIENPSGSRAKELEKVIKDNNDRKDGLFEKKRTVRTEIIDNLKNNRGFLTELSALGSLLFYTGFPEALIVWLVFFILFFSIELFVLAIKFFDKNNDYEEGVQRQMEIYIDQLNALKDDSTKII